MENRMAAASAAGVMGSAGRVAAAIVLAALAGAPAAPAQDHGNGRRSERAAGPEHAAVRAEALGIPRTREGSGTSWLPDLSPMHALHGSAGAWELMLHGNAFLQYIDEGSDRGGEGLGSINWVMGMARRPLEGGDLTLRVMLSVEPLTAGECGYADLLATGESCQGEPLHDRQHPHDVFMELAAAYAREVADGVALQLYGGLAGEPAVGPAAYPHRVSAQVNPYAPISHHWLDATHVTFGVVTAGVLTRHWKLEGSLFNGREPDEGRRDLDLAPLDSYGGRLSYAAERWALQVSAAHLEEAEQHEPGGARADVARYTASATYHAPAGGVGIWAATAAWGRNVEEDASADALLLESSLELGNRDLAFARGELVEKTGGDLVLPAAFEHDVFTVGKASLGYVRQFGPYAGVAPGIGATVSLSVVPDGLEPFYGDRAAFGWSIFASVRPAPVRRQPPAGHAAHDHMP